MLEFLLFLLVCCLLYKQHELIVEIGAYRESQKEFLDTLERSAQQHSVTEVQAHATVLPHKALHPSRGNRGPRP